MLIGEIYPQFCWKMPVSFSIRKLIFPVKNTTQTWLNSSSVLFKSLLIFYWNSQTKTTPGGCPERLKGCPSFVFCLLKLKRKKISFQQLDSFIVLSDCLDNHEWCFWPLCCVFFRREFAYYPFDLQQWHFEYLVTGTICFDISRPCIRILNQSDRAKNTGWSKKKISQLLTFNLMSTLLVKLILN